MPKILECSSKGDKRYSAFYAKVEVFECMDSIESHYQRSKEFYDDRLEDYLGCGLVADHGMW